MPSHPDHSEPTSSAASLAEAFAEERRRLIFGRLYGAALFALVPIALGAVVNVFVFTDRLPQRLATFAVEAALCLAVVGCARSRLAERRAITVALAFALGMLTCLLWAVSLSPQDLDVLVCPIASTMVGCTLFFPWGLGPQAIVSVYTMGGFLLLLPWSSLHAERITNILIGLVLGCATSIIGALVLDRQRRATFIERERVAALAHERELLLDAGRELASTVNLPDLIDRITRHGRRLVGSDATSLTLFDHRRQVLRSVGVSSDRPTRHGEVLNLEFSVDEAGFFVEELMRRAVLEIPGGTPLDSLLQYSSRFGFARTLYVTIQRDGRFLGFLNFSQRAAEPRFSEHRIRLAEGIAHQAAIALTNARLIEDLQSADRLKSEFVSTMSHELRTPLHVIIGYTEMIEDFDSEERRWALDKIRGASRELLDLIQATLDLSRMEAGKDAPSCEPFRLPELWEELASEFAALPQPPRVALRWEPIDALALHSDRRKVKTILKNLVGNALKFTPAGEVVATCRLVGEACVFTVRDTGVGISQDQLPVIFDMFRQADSSDSRSYGGVGLGLYIVRRLVAQLNATIAVDSEPGRGSTFTIRVPTTASANTSLRATG